jgi:hypothetical protein
MNYDCYALLSICSLLCAAKSLAAQPETVRIEGKQDLEEETQINQWPGIYGWWT